MRSFANFINLTMVHNCLWRHQVLNIQKVNKKQNFQKINSTNSKRVNFQKLIPGKKKRIIFFFP